jgi:alpha-glucosidase
VAKQFRERNVAAQRSDPSSIYQLYRRLSALRRKQRSLALGAYRPLVASGDLLLYVREVADERLLIALNFGGEPIAASFAAGHLAGRLLLSSRGDRDDEPVTGSVDLREHEGIVIELSRASVLP